MIIKISFDPKRVLLQEKGELLIECSPYESPGLPLWVATAGGSTVEEFYSGDNPAKDSGYILVHPSRGTIRLSKTQKG